MIVHGRKTRLHLLEVIEDALCKRVLDDLLFVGVIKVFILIATLHRILPKACVDLQLGDYAYLKRSTAEICRVGVVRHDPDSLTLRELDGVELDQKLVLILAVRRVRVCGQDLEAMQVVLAVPEGLQQMCRESMRWVPAKPCQLMHASATRSLAYLNDCSFFIGN